MSHPRSLASLASVAALGAAFALLHCGGDEPQAKPPTTVASAPPPLPPAPSVSTPAAPEGPRPPVAKKQPVTHEYFGTKVTDDYEWLEDPKDPAVKAWSADENAFTRKTLDALPERAKTRDRASMLLTQRSASWFGLHNAGGTWFAMKAEPPKQQDMLVVIGALGDAKTERIVLDPNALDPSGATAIDWYAPSWDGTQVAVSLSKNGSERGDLHFYDTKTGKAREEIVSHAQNGTAGGSAAFTKDGKGVYYTRYPHAGERAAEDMEFYQQIWFHKFGTAEDKDTYVLGKDFPRIAEVFLGTAPDGNAILATVANGDGGEFMHFVAGADGKFTQLSKFDDKWADAMFGVDDSIFVLTRKDAPRGQILRLQRPYKTPELVVAQGDGTIEQITPTAHTLYVGELLGGPSRLRAYALSAKAADIVKSTPLEIPLPVVSSIGELARTNKGDDVVYRAQSYTLPPAYFQWDAKTKTATRTALFQTTPASMDDVEVTRDTCTSKDGTKVPINVMKRKGTAANGANPTLLSGYGGYSVSRKPRFRAIARLWLDAGGVLAEANLRGGGEFGEAWHLAGNLTNKQNVFDDFYACERYLIDSKITSPAKLAIMGGSNGGLLMGAEIVQHPDTVRAVVSLVGIYDMLRVELSPNGAFNVTEFGTVKKEDQWKALFSYSPLHNVKDGVAYPAVLMLTGANDPRVDPYHSRKFTARLQAASSSGRPILLRTSDSTGHGIGTPLAAEIEEDADIYAFLLHELGANLP